MGVRMKLYKRVLLIPTHMELHTRSLPLGPAYIAGVLEKEGYKVRVYDTPPYQKSNLIDFIKKFRPDIIGISCMTPSFSKACEMAKEIKANFDLPIVFGGIHPTAMPVQTLENDFIDFVIPGEGEYTFLELVRALSGEMKLSDVLGLGYKESKKIIMNSPRPMLENIDSIPFPSRHLFSKWYFQRQPSIRGQWFRITNIIGSRGCPFNCSYCASKVMFGRRVRFNSPERLVDEMEHVVKKYNLDGVSLSDDTFSVDKNRVIEICKLIKERGLRMKWRVQMRVDTVTDEIAKELRSAGCVQADLGVESGSPRILKILNKGTTPEQAVNALRILKKHGIKTCATFMIGNPTETREDIEMTRQLAHKINADYTQFYITTPYPGTPMYLDIIKKDPKLGGVSYDHYRHGGIDLTSFVESDVSEKELVELQKDLNNQFLSKTGLLMLKNKWMLIDMAMLCLQKPSVITKAIKSFIRSGKITEFYRVFYYHQNFRRI
jgi:radical SAM superfamily enzyme YgiQ (UPF0313 family)